MNEHVIVNLNAGITAELHNHGSDTSEVLVLQGKPIGQPVVQHGPFVMNTDAEIRQAFSDYQQTQFGGAYKINDSTCCLVCVCVCACVLLLLLVANIVSLFGVSFGRGCCKITTLRSTGCLVAAHLSTHKPIMPQATASPTTCLLPFAAI